MSRLFYPTLFSVTAALAVTLWTRHGLSTQWVSVLGAAVAQAQTPAPSGSAPPGNRPPENGAAGDTRFGAQRLPPTGRPSANQSPTPTPVNVASRPRQAPLTQLQIDTPGGPQAMEVTRPVPVVSAKVVARIGGEIILVADVLPQVNERMEQLASQCPPEQHEQLFQMLVHQQVMEAVKFKLIVAAMKKEIPTDKFGEVEKDILKQFDKMALPQLKKHWKVKTDAELDAKLKEKGSSIKRQRAAFIDQILVQEWLKKEVTFDEHVSHQQMLDYYRANIKDYEFKAKVRYEEIRVNYGKHRTRQAAWNTIHQLARQIYGGARWADLAKTHSDAVSAEKGGWNDWTNEGSIACKPLDQALFQLPVGALSQVIDDDRRSGFLIVRVLERTAAGTTSFHDAQAGIQQKIKTQRETEAKQKKLAAFLEKERLRAWTIYDDQPLEAKKPGDKKLR